MANPEEHPAASNAGNARKPAHRSFQSGNILKKLKAV